MKRWFERLIHDLTLTLLPRSLSRTRMLETLPSAKKWLYGKESEMQFSPPACLDGKIPKELGDYFKPFKKNGEFVCEFNSGQLVGKRPMGVSIRGKIIEETIYGNPRYLLGRHVKSFLESRTQEPIQLDTVCSLAGVKSNSYGHWIQDYLPRLRGVEYYESKTGIKPLILVEQDAPQWKIDSLRLMGVEEDDLAEWTVNRARVKKLIVPSNPRYQDSWPWGVVAAEPIHFVRDRILGNVSKPSGYPPNIYISREHAPWRRVLNEHELITALRRVGFEVVVPERKTFEEQVKIFNQAKVIVSPHGSNLRNITFASDATVIELFGDGYVRPDFFNVASVLELKYGFLIGSTQEANTQDFTVDIDKIFSLLVKMVPAHAHLS